MLDSEDDQPKTGQDNMQEIKYSKEKMCSLHIKIPHSLLRTIKHEVLRQEVTIQKFVMDAIKNNIDTDPKE